MEIRTGNIGKFKRGMFSSIKLLYSGMPTPQTFAISPILDNASLNGESSYAPIIYYSVESEIIWVVGAEFKVAAIEAHYIKLDLIKR